MNLTPEHETTAVAMSGGVDSSAAAWLLREQGRKLLGLTMRLLPADAGEAGARDARRVAQQLDIPHQVLDLGEEFRARVMEPFAAAYEEGRTPNPCALCNRGLKFGILLERARALGCRALATGHYAKTAYDPASGRYLLLRAARPEKDQSYFLCLLTQQQLAAALFPLGDMSKEEIRALALQQGLATARRRDSQDLCFVPDGDYAAFLRQYTGRDYPPGDFLDEVGVLLGRHRGIVHYTVGQRRGLGVSGADRLYVQEIRPAENQVVLGPGHRLYHRTVEAEGLNLIACAALPGTLRAQVRLRSRHQPQSALVEQVGADRVRITFDQPQRASAPGQVAAFYDGDTVVGGAIITHA